MICKICMKLDPRIKGESIIYAPSSKVKPGLHEKGYFAHEITKFASLKKCDYGELIGVCGGFMQRHPYLREYDASGFAEYYAFYIPESSLSPVENKPRPYTPEEFCDKFNVGQQIAIRKKDDKESEQDLVLQGLWYNRRDGKTIAYARLGSHLYALDELFNDFEWRALFKRDFQPFGVEE